MYEWSPVPVAQTVMATEAEELVKLPVPFTSVRKLLTDSLTSLLAVFPTSDLLAVNLTIVYAVLGQSIL